MTDWGYYPVADVSRGHRRDVGSQVGTWAERRGWESSRYQDYTLYNQPVKGGEIGSVGLTPDPTASEISDHGPIFLRHDGKAQSNWKGPSDLVARGHALASTHRHGLMSCFSSRSTRRFIRVVAKDCRRSASSRARGIDSRTPAASVVNDITLEHVGSRTTYRQHPKSHSRKRKHLLQMEGAKYMPHDDQFTATGPAFTGAEEHVFDW